MNRLPKLISAINYECFALDCGGIAINPRFDPKAPIGYDAAVKHICKHPVVAPGMCPAHRLSTDDYERRK